MRLCWGHCPLSRGGLDLSTANETGLIGTLLAERFRVDRLVGTGGMAAVYQATDTLLGRTVAVKLFRADSGEAADPERQRGEVTVLASLNHFALVTLFDAGVTSMDGSPRSFIVMEYVDGSDLRSTIASGPLPPTDVAAIGADISEALHYVHGRDIIHRDVKPANVLLAHGGMHGRTIHAKLADFGIARLVDGSRLTATGTLLGTANYLSPEQALGSAIGPSSDVYSLGLVLLECLTAERSYPGTAVESAMARLQRQPVIPDSLGTGWADVLERMTRREPDERPSAEAAAEMLRGLAAGVPVVVAQTGPSTGATTGATKPLPVSTDSVGADSALHPADPTAPSDPTAPTVMLGAMAPATTGTVATSTGTTSTARRQSARRSTRVLLWFLALVVVAIAVVTVLFMLRPSEPETGPPPSYPAVQGPLGEHLQQLQESVNP